MSLSKEIKLGSIGTLTISESSGVATLAISIAESVGGGDVAGFAKVGASVNVQLGVQELIDAGLALAAAKFPSAAPEINGLKAIMDAAIAAV